jgi:FdhE protein
VSVVQQAAALEDMAERAGVDPAVLKVVGHVAALPLLIASGQRAADDLQARPWSLGYCPVCAAWPTLAEMRGLARELFLRCGRCGGDWPYDHGACAFCGAQEHRSQSYFAAEHERESRRAVTCDTCHGYLKTIATLGRLGPAELLLHDLQTVELDVSALANGYARPDGPGWTMSVRIESAARSGSRWRGRWWR